MPSENPWEAMDALGESIHAALFRLFPVEVTKGGGHCVRMDDRGHAAVFCSGGLVPRHLTTHGNLDAAMAEFMARVARD